LYAMPQALHNSKMPESPGRRMKPRMPDFRRAPSSAQLAQSASFMPARLRMRHRGAAAARRSTCDAVREWASINRYEHNYLGLAWRRA
jgi:hypothetical protein